MRHWGVPLALGLVLLLVAGGLQALAGGGEPEAVLARPTSGDKAHYVGYERASEAEGQIRILGNRSLEFTQTWTTKPVTLPNAQTHTMIALDRTYAPSTPDGDTQGASSSPPMLALGAPPSPLGTLTVDDGDGTVARSLSDLDYIYEHVPSQPAAVHLDQVLEHREGNFTKVLTTTSRTQQGCAADLSGVLAGRSSDEARRAIRPCLESLPWVHVDRIGLETGFEQHPRFGTTWLVEAHVEGTLAGGGEHVAIDLELRTSPELSMPLEHDQTWHLGEGPDAVTVHRSLDLVGWAEGDEPLPSVDPIGPQPTIPTVAWRPTGPPSEEWPPMAFEEARQEVRSTEDARSYMASHPDARLYLAAYVDRHADERSQPATAAANPGKCRNAAEPSMLPQAPRPTAGTAEEAGWWFYWSGRGEDMMGYLNAPKATQTNPLGLSTDTYQTYTVTFDAPGLTDGLDVPGQAPSLQGLHEHRDLTDAHGFEGDPFVAVIPHLPPAEDPPAVDGVVGRTWCMLTPGTWDFEYIEAGVVFHHGVATGFYQLDVVAQGAGLETALLSEPPSEDGDAWLPPGPVGVAGAVLVVGSVLGSAASRALPSMYSRFTSEDVLESPLRQRLLDAIDDQPGITLPELASSVDKHRSTLDHHLRMLERHGHITVTRTGSKVLAHPRGHPEAAYADVLCLAGARELLALVQGGSELNQTELAEHLDVSKSYVSRLVDRLENAGLLEREREGRTVRLVATEATEGLELADPQ